MIVASRLTDGRVVFMTDGRGWTESINDGLVVEAAEQGAELLEEANRSIDECVVVDPYLIDVTIDKGRRRPVQMREAIRAFGPSIAGEWVAEES
jgi:hypothetical protein